MVPRYNTWHANYDSELAPAKASSPWWNHALRYQPVEKEENCFCSKGGASNSLCVLRPPPPHPTPFPLPPMDCTGIGFGRIYFWCSFSSPPHFFSFRAEEPFSFYSDQTSYLSICLEEHSRLQVEHFSQEELKKKVLTYYLSVLCWLLVVSWVPDQR